MKWEQNRKVPEAIDNMLLILIPIFKELGFEDPKNESIIFQLIIEGIVQNIVSDGIKSQMDKKNVLLKKYLGRKTAQIS